MFCLADTSCDISILKYLEYGIGPPPSRKMIQQIQKSFLIVLMFTSASWGKWFNSTKTCFFEIGCFNHQLYSLLNSSCFPSQVPIFPSSGLPSHVGHGEEGCRRQRCTASCLASGRARQATCGCRDAVTWCMVKFGCFYKRFNPPKKNSLEVR